MLSISMISS